MKANLALFVADFANALALEDWDLEPNPDTNGGRVIIVEGDLTEHSEIYVKLCAEAAKLGNYPNDLLACVPPAFVVHDSHETFSTPARALAAQGTKVWDASSIDVREHFPTDREALPLSSTIHAAGLKAGRSSTTASTNSGTTNIASGSLRRRTPMIFFPPPKMMQRNLLRDGP
jgi:hypothetical protein